MVEPTLFLNRTLEANTPDNYNLISLKGDTIGKLDFFGQGAGMFPTANAVVQDILDIKEQKCHLKREFDKKLEYCPELTKDDYLVRSNVDIRDLFADYELSNEGSYIMVHQIPVGEMHKLMKSVLKMDKSAFMVSLPSQGAVA